MPSARDPGDDDTVAAAVDSRGVGFEEADCRAQVERAPSAAAGPRRSSLPRSLRSPAVKRAASRLASLGPVGPRLTAGPLRLGGNEGPLTRTSSEPTQLENRSLFRRFE